VSGGAGVPPDELRAIALEARKTRDTADRIANGEQPREADDVRVLAGMIRQIADQVERLTVVLDGSASSSAGSDQQERERLAEEDVSPEDAPAEPARATGAGPDGL
jgi:hypothetical protein